MQIRTWLPVAVGALTWATMVHGQVVIDMPAPNNRTPAESTTASTPPPQAEQGDVGDLALARYARARAGPRDTYPNRGWPWSPYGSYGSYGSWGYPWGFFWRGSVVFGHHHGHHHGHDMSPDTGG